MAGEERRVEQIKSNLDSIIEQGFEVARGLRTEAELASNKVQVVPEISSKIDNAHKSRVLELTADRIQEALALIDGRRLDYPSGD